MIFIKEYIKRNKSQIFWVTLSFILTILFVCFIYSDIIIVTKQSLNLIQTLNNGHPLGFYAINYGLVPDKYLSVFTCATYDIPIFIIFAIWNFPLWIAQNFLHINITESLLCLVWLKLILILFLGLSVWVIKLICHELGINNKNINYVLLIFISSPFLIMSLFIMSQYDIIMIFFMLLGILMYLRGNTKWFIIWFAIAIPLKMFAIFIFIPLILLKYKKLLVILKYIFIGLIPLIIGKLISSSMYMYTESTSHFVDDMLNRLFSASINVNLGNASLFCISLVGIAIFCYMKSAKDKNELNRFVIYIPLLVFTSFFIFVNFNSYWVILLTPFTAIIFFQNIKYLKINLLLDIFAYISYIVSSIFLCNKLYSVNSPFAPSSIKRMLLPNLFGFRADSSDKYNSIASLFADIGLDKYIPFFLASFVVSLVAILIINFPRRINIVENQNLEYGLLFSRLLIILPVPILVAICYYYR